MMRARWLWSAVVVAASAAFGGVGLACAHGVEHGGTAAPEDDDAAAVPIDAAAEAPRPKDARGPEPDSAVEGGCLSDGKACGNSCVSPGDPAYGCGTTSCAPCSLPHVAQYACYAGECTPSACEPGRADCDGQPANGCEVDLTTDPGHCGACGVACAAPPQGTPTCVAGACDFVCGGGTTKCASKCIDTSADVQNCGACANACSLAHATAACVSGKCAVASCAAGFYDCDGDPANGCESAQPCPPSCTQFSSQQGWPSSACEKGGNAACSGHGPATSDCDHCCVNETCGTYGTSQNWAPPYKCEWNGNGACGGKGTPTTDCDYCCP